MKKTYISPTMRVKHVVIEHIMEGASITEIGGNSGLGFGEGETPEDADAKGIGGFNVWED